MSLHTIIERIEQGDLAPHEVDMFRNYCAVWLFRYYEEYGTLCAESALWLTANRDQYKSQAEAERAWDAQERGQRQILVKNLVKGIEHIQEVLTSQHFQLTRASKEANAL